MNNGKQRRTRGKPDDVDRHVGAVIRNRRYELGLSQTALADAIGLTFQQVQKYERGTNRIGAGRLFQLSKALEVPVSHFFAGLDVGPTKPPLMADRMTADMARAFSDLPLASRRCVMDVASRLAAAHAEAAAP